MARGLIFDYGGTLDTKGCHWGKVLWHAYEQSHVPVGEEAFRNAYVYGERTLATNRIITPQTTFRETLSEKIKLQLEWLETHGENDGLATEYHDAILGRAYSVAKRNTAESAEVLSLLAARYPMVLVSNFYGNIATVLREFAFEGMFRHVIESAVVGIRKPDPRIFALGCEEMGIKAEDIMVVGDSYDKDILPANSIGCRTAWIKGEGWTDEEIAQPVADHIIYELSELKGILL